ncbi:hypothetical protein AAHC03_0132 [Spirometra sp. Aus1]
MTLNPPGRLNVPNSDPWRPTFIKFRSTTKCCHFAVFLQVAMVLAVFNKAWSGYLHLLSKYPLRTQCVSTGPYISLLVQLHRSTVHRDQAHPHSENGRLRPAYYGALYGLFDNRPGRADKELVH